MVAAGHVPPSSTAFVALLDTGAERSSFDSGVIKRLGISSSGETGLLTMGGPEPVARRTFELTIDLSSRPGLSLVQLGQVEVAEADMSAFSGDHNAIIGVDILRRCTMLLNWHKGRGALKF